MTAPALADTFTKEFRLPATDLGGMPILSGEWTIIRTSGGVYPSEFAKNRPAVISVGNFNHRSYSITILFDVGGGDGEIGLIIGDPDGRGTRPSYYISVMRYEAAVGVRAITSVGTIPEGFLSGAKRSAPLYVGDPAPLGAGRYARVVVDTQGDWFPMTIAAPGLEVDFDEAMTLPMGKLTFFAFPPSSRTSISGLTAFNYEGFGPSITRLHENRKLRRHILGLMD